MGSCSGPRLHLIPLVLLLTLLQTLGGLGAAQQTSLSTCRCEVTARNMGGLQDLAEYVLSPACVCTPPATNSTLRPAAVHLLLVEAVYPINATQQLRISGFPAGLQQLHVVGGAKSGHTTLQCPGGLMPIVNVKSIWWTQRLLPEESRRDSESTEFSEEYVEETDQAEIALANLIARYAAHAASRQTPTDDVAFQILALADPNTGAEWSGLINVTKISIQNCNNGGLSIVTYPGSQANVDPTAQANISVQNCSFLNITSQTTARFLANVPQGAAYPSPSALQVLGSRVPLNVSLQNLTFSGCRHRIGSAWELAAALVAALPPGSSLVVTKSVFNGNGLAAEQLSATPPYDITLRTMQVMCGTLFSGDLQPQVTGALANSALAASDPRCLLSATGNSSRCVGSAPVNGCHLGVKQSNFTRNVATTTSAAWMYCVQRACSMGVWDSYFEGNSVFPLRAIRSQGTFADKHEKEVSSICFIGAIPIDGLSENNYRLPAFCPQRFGPLMYFGGLANATNMGNHSHQLLVNNSIWVENRKGSVISVALTHKDKDDNRIRWPVDVYIGEFNIQEP